jgi:hypothetical protein
MIPRAFAGSATDGGIYELDVGHMDHESVITVRAETNALAPGGSSADHSFDWLRVSLTHTMPVSVTVTPVVDGLPLTVAAFTVNLPAETKRKSKVFERPIRVPHMRDGVATRTYSPRGTWLSVRLEATVTSPGDLIFDGVDVEYEVLTPTKVRA